MTLLAALSAGKILRDSKCFLDFRTCFFLLLIHFFLNENQPPLEPNHGLVNTDLFRESVTLLEMGNERLKERAKLEEWIMTRFSPLLVVPAGESRVPVSLTPGDVVEVIKVLLPAQRSQVGLSPEKPCGYESHFITTIAVPLLIVINSWCLEIRVRYALLMRAVKSSQPFSLGTTWIIYHAFRGFVRQTGIICFSLTLEHILAKCTALVGY